MVDGEETVDRWAVDSGKWSDSTRTRPWTVSGRWTDRGQPVDGGQSVDGELEVPRGRTATC